MTGPVSVFKSSPLCEVVVLAQIPVPRRTSVEPQATRSTLPSYTVPHTPYLNAGCRFTRGSR